MDDGRALADLQGALKNVDFSMREAIRDSLLRMSRSYAARAAERAASEAGGAAAAPLPAEGGDGKTAKWLEALDGGVCTLLYHPYWEDDHTAAAERAANALPAQPAGAAA